MDNIFNKFAEVGVRGTPQGLQVLTNADGGPVYYRSYGTFVLPPRQIGLRSTLKF